MKTSLFLATLFPLFALAATQTIDNSGLSVSYDDVAGTFSATDKASGRVFLKDGKLEGGGTKAAVEAAADAIFGPGKKIVVAQADGSTTALEVYDNLPFLLVRQERKNGGTAELDVQKAIPATFKLDLGKPAAELKTMGTGGLLPVDKNPGSYFFLTVADPATRNGVVSGWLTNDRGSGTFFSGIQAGQVELKAQLEHGHLFVPPGQSAKLDTLAIGYFPDARLGQEQFADAVKKQYAIKLRPLVATYCSWYAEGPGHGRAGNPATTVELSRFIAKELKPFGLGVIQIDDGWQDGPQIGGPATEFGKVSQKLNYRDGIAPVAKELEKDGIIFGLWWLPFGRNHMQPEYKDHQDWFVKRPDGKPLRQHSFGGTCLDSTHPEVQEHLKTLAKTIRGWGVKYYKMDGISVGAGIDHVYINDGYKNDNFSNCLPLHDRTKTNIEAMRLGLKTIREGAGDDVFFSGCCAVQNMRTYAGTIGLVDSMRVGPDFNHDGEGIRSGPLRGSRMYFMNGRIWWNDPDPSKVRTSNEGCEGDPSINGGVTLNQARLTSSWVSLTGQFFLVSDWLPNLPPERIEILRRTLAHHEATARPVDYFDNALANTWLVTDTQKGIRRDVIGLFNFYGQGLQINHPCAKLGLDPEKTYAGFDFWANALVPPFHGDFTATLPPQSCQVISVRPLADRPQLLGTSRHVSQCFIDVLGEKWDAPTATLAGICKVIGGHPTELRILTAATNGEWKAKEAELSEEALAADATISMKAEPGLLRVTITSPVNCDAMWSVTFNKKPMSISATTPITGLKAEQANPGEPVMLSWIGASPFNEVKRDGVLIATASQVFADAAAPMGKACTYTVTPIGFNGKRGATRELTFTTKAFVLGPVPPPPETSLGKLQPLKTTSGWGSMQVGKEVSGTPLKLSGQTYADGIGLHANGEAVYACQPAWKQFVAIVGLDDSQRTDPRASIVAKVVAEDAAGKQAVLGKTPVLSSGKVEQWHFDLPLPAGTAKVHLIVEDAGDGIACDHADWVNAGFR
jgi:hypothetical protein